MSEKQGWLVWVFVVAAGALVWVLGRREYRRLEAVDGPRTGGNGSAPRRASPAAVLSLNRASLEVLQTLPGVGPVMAGRIIAARPFKSVDDLLKVEGIGRVTLETLASLVKP